MYSTRKWLTLLAWFAQIASSKWSFPCVYIFEDIFQLRFANFKFKRTQMERFDDLQTSNTNGLKWNGFDDLQSSNTNGLKWNDSTICKSQIQTDSNGTIRRFANLRLQTLQIVRFARIASSKRSLLCVHIFEDIFHLPICKSQIQTDSNGAIRRFAKILP